MARCFPFVLILAEVIAMLQGPVVITGPSNKTAQEGTNMQMKCSVTGLKTQPLVRWRISGREYTPSTLPDRYFPSSTGLLIYSTSLKDDGVTVQCYIVMYDPSISPPFVVINSSVGVVHIIPRDHTGQVSRSSYNHLHNSIPTITPTPHQSTIITTSPSTSSSSLRQPFSTSAIFFVVAILTLILTSIVVLCLVLHLIKTRGPKASSTTPKTLLTMKIVHG